jgi:CTP:molybdopterin cytidylyltransferase MocA
MATDLYDVMIAAGGFARRMGAAGDSQGRPKSLFFGASRPFVVSTVRNALEADCRRPLVLSNRPEWNDNLRHALAHIDGVDVVEDIGYSSTFLLARDFASRMQDRFLFLYGHSPRPAEQLQKLVGLGTAVAASGYKNSTKVKTVVRGELFLEPPYLVDRRSILTSHVSDWASYFDEVSNDLGIFVSDGPAEPNTRAEMDQYVRYYASIL